MSDDIRKLNRKGSKFDPNPAAIKQAGKKASRKIEKKLVNVKEEAFTEWR